MESVLKKCLSAAGLVAACFVVTAPAPAATATLSATLTNVANATEDRFANALAAVGANKVLVGAPLSDNGAQDTGAAYLVHTNGALLATFTDPFPAVSDAFGHAVAALDSGRVIIGAPGTGSGLAHLFSINGSLLATFSNPNPSVLANFGAAVAAVGPDHVLVGAWLSDVGAIDAGAAYLFTTNGGLVTTFTNPAPADFDYFGHTVTAAGADKVLISAYADNAGAPDSGTAYLFSTNGQLLGVFSNPSPATNDQFGISVAAIGSGLVVIGASRDNTGANDAGAAYVFTAAGALLHTITNPAPSVADYFGITVAAVGTDKIAIGAVLDDVGANNSGTAYLFSTNGTLLTPIPNPTPAATDFFGVAIAGLGNDHVVIGASLDDTGINNAGTAYVFALNLAALPMLSIQDVSSGLVRVSWSVTLTNAVLEELTTLASPPATNVWGTVLAQRQTNAAEVSITVPAFGRRFYRLRFP
jgi:hypothetical protein